MRGLGRSHASQIIIGGQPPILRAHRNGRVSVICTKSKFKKRNVFVHVMESHCPFKGPSFEARGSLTTTYFVTTISSHIQDNCPTPISNALLLLWCSRCIQWYRMYGGYCFGWDGMGCEQDGMGCWANEWLTLNLQYHLTFPAQTLSLTNSTLLPILKYF